MGENGIHACDDYKGLADAFRGAYEAALPSRPESTQENFDGYQRETSIKDGGWEHHMYRGKYNSLFIRRRWSKDLYSKWIVIDGRRYKVLMTRFRSVSGLNLISMAIYNNFTFRLRNKDNNVLASYTVANDPSGRGRCSLDQDNPLLRSALEMVTGVSIGPGSITTKMVKVKKLHPPYRL